MTALHALGHALTLTGSMTWEILWALILGFGLTSVVQAAVPRAVIERRLGADDARSIALATGFGAASSSCSYAAVALARALVRKGASFAAAMAFEIASTNLVIELGVVLVVLLGWQFTVGEFVGGPLMIVLVAVWFRLVVRTRVVDAARRQAAKGAAGSMEGHAAMDMTIGGDGSIWSRLRSPQGITSVSHIFVMEWAAVVRDIVAGLLVAGALAAWVPVGFWRALFVAGHPALAPVTGPLLGPVVAVVSFVCSIGNVPLAAVLWNGGISFGGVMAFIFADLIIVPILLIYRKYYGTRMTLMILAGFYVAMVAAGYGVHLLFDALGIVPSGRHATVLERAVRWNYTTILDIVFLLGAAALITRFVRSGGLPMLKMMGGAPPPGPDDPSRDDTASGDAASGHEGHRPHHP
jgi:uncharacterized protein